MWLSGSESSQLKEMSHGGERCSDISNTGCAWPLRKMDLLLATSMYNVCDLACLELWSRRNTGKNWWCYGEGLCKVLIAIRSAWRWGGEAGSISSFLIDFQGGESHLTTPKHLGTIVYNTEGTSNTRLGNLDTSHTLGRFLDVRRKDLWPPYSF